MNWTSDTKYLVIVNYYDNDVSWARRLKMPYIIYYKDRPDKEPFTAVNKAKSETNLLKFIVDFYDQLPENVITIHQYEYKNYHKGSVVDILNDPLFTEKYEASSSKGFWCFNTYVLGYIGHQVSKMMESGWWKGTMGPYFGSIESCGDFTLGKMGCAQFVVSRDRIRSLQRDFYSDMYDWLVRNSLEEEPTGFDPRTLERIPSKTHNHPNSNHVTSRYMEWSWELIFTAYKKTEDIRQRLPDGRLIEVIYGFGNYYRDVTHIFLKRFVVDGKVKLHMGNLNKYFGDHVAGSPKTLRITINGVMMELDELWNLSFPSG